MALGILELKLTCACLNAPGWYSSRKSATQTSRLPSTCSKSIQKVLSLIQWEGWTEWIQSIDPLKKCNFLKSHLRALDKYYTTAALQFVVSYLKVVTSEKIGGVWSTVISTLGTWYGGVVMGVLLPFNEAAILYRDFNSAPSQKQNIIVFAANNSRCCECHVAPTNMQSAPTSRRWCVFSTY